ncbi:hypothetical protein CLOM_g16480 [Closterium sp. NIES-68]|nr:hypothetical protein CLOM_g16480 [Closterium sp. NIES-68]
MSSRDAEDRSSRSESYVIGERVGGRVVPYSMFPGGSAIGSIMSNGYAGYSSHTGYGYGSGMGGGSGEEQEEEEEVEEEAGEEELIGLDTSSRHPCLINPQLTPEKETAVMGAGEGQEDLFPRP